MDRLGLGGTSGHKRALEGGEAGEEGRAGEPCSERQQRDCTDDLQRVAVVARERGAQDHVMPGMQPQTGAAPGGHGAPVDDREGPRGMRGRPQSHL